MAAVGLKLPRVEGGMVLVQEESGEIRPSLFPPRQFEGLLSGRAPQDAIFLTQKISADSAVSHAVAAAMAWEAAGEIPVAHNGILVRDLLHTLSIMHATLRGFYFQVLPDFLPPSALAEYKGGSGELSAMAEALKGRGADSWANFHFAHPFDSAEIARLAENRLRAGRLLGRLQRMMAMLGGKFPVVMTIVPGGVTLPVTERLIIRLRDYLAAMADFLRSVPLDDALLLANADGSLGLLGRGGEALISAGTIGDDAGPAASLFPKGVWLAGKLEPLQSRISENIGAAFYRLAGRPGGRGTPLEPAPGKPGAYTWIKAPRYRGRPMETGALARLVITHRAGSRRHTKAVVEAIEGGLKLPLAEANTVAGRLVARLGELAPLLDRSETLLAQLTPGQPSLIVAENLSSLSGEAIGRIEAPAGMLQHRMVVEKGRVAHSDIISPSTWNGTPRDEKNGMSGLELALNRPAPNLRTQPGQLAASRIVHSYFFSASDAVQ